MDNPDFEQVIDLKMSPSIRKHKTSVISQFNTNSFNQLFIIQEAGVYDKRKVRNKKILLSLFTIIAVLCIVLLIFIFATTDTQTEQDTTTQIRPGLSNETGGDIEVPGKSPTGLYPDKEKESPGVDGGPGNDDDGTTESAVGSNWGSFTSPDYHTDVTMTTNAPQSSTQEILFTGNCTNSDKTSGCISSSITECHPQGGCETYLPNRYLYAEDPAKLRSRFNGFYGMLSEFTCHPRSAKFLCALLHPPCYASPTFSVDEPHYAFDVANIPARRTPVPCLSLGENIGTRCFERAAELTGWNGFFSNMPQSTSLRVCFGGANTPAPASCTPNPCLNGGLCLTQRGRQYCKCRTGYYGDVCDETTTNNQTINRGECVVIPEECSKLLPYNTTRGINLNGTNLAYVPSWNIIGPVAREKRVLCALAYPQCMTTAAAKYQVCFKECNKFKLDTGVEFLLASMDYPSLQCEELPRYYEIPADTNCLSYNSTEAG